MINKDIKNILLSLQEADFYEKADLHIHSYESDGVLSPLDIVKQAKERNLKFIAIADHNTINAYLSTNILAEEIVIPAVEFDCFYKGSLVHILGYGIDIDNKPLKELFAKTKLGTSRNIIRLFRLRSPKDVIKKIKDAGGIPVLAHPACSWAFSFESMIKDLISFGLEGIEVYYPYKGLRGILKFYSEDYIKELADKYHLIKTGGTDSHGKTLLS